MNKSMLQQAYAIFAEREARRAIFRKPHKDKVKAQRRAKNKVARKSRRANRK